MLQLYIMGLTMALGTAEFDRLRHHGSPALSAATGIDAKKNM
jgi:hypothetical protein